MNMYLIALYIHITGALAMFAGLGIEGIVFKNLKNASDPRACYPMAWIDEDSPYYLRLCRCLSPLYRSLPCDTILGLEFMGFNRTCASCNSFRVRQHNRKKSRHVDCFPYFQ